jgi:outer membrane protein assembly factor BamB
VHDPYRFGGGIIRTIRSLAGLGVWIRVCALACLLGTFAESAGASPRLASAGADPFEGVWVGQVTAPNESVAIGFAFTPSDGGLVASFYMPEMFVYGMGLGPADVKEGVYTFKPLDTTLELSGQKLVGTFGISRLPVVLERGGHFSPEPPRRELPAAPKPAWSRALGAGVWASPAAAGDAVYVGCTDGTFHAVRATDGKELWKWAGPHPLFGEALVLQDALAFVDEHCDLVCLDRKDGKSRWRVCLHDKLLGGAPPAASETFNHRTAVPVAAGGILYVGSTDNGIYAIDAATGKKIWRHDARARIYAGVLLLDGQRLIAGCYDGSVLVLDMGTREEIARVQLSGPVVSTPVVAGGTVVLGCRDYMLYGLRLRDLSVSWRDAYWFSWVESTPRLVDGTIYIGASDYRRVSALDPASGKRLWAADVRGLTWGTPAVTADTVFAGASSQSTAVIAHEGGLTALDRKTGAVRWRAAVPSSKDVDRAGYIGSPALAGNLVIAAGVDGTLVAYPIR